MTGKKRRLLIIAGSLLAALLLFVVLGGYLTRRAGEGALADSGMIAAVERDDLQVIVSGSGALEAHQKELRSKTGGVLAAMEIEEGQAVEAGQLLARLELQDLSVQIDRQRLDIQIMENDLAQLRHEETAAPVKSSGSGELIWRAVAGDRVQEGAVVATIQDHNRAEVRGRVDQSWLGYLQAGQQAELYISDPGYWVYGLVVEVGAIPRPGPEGTVLYDLLAEIENPGWLSEGMAGQLTIHTAWDTVTTEGDALVSFPPPLAVRAPIAGIVGSLQLSGGSKVTEGQVISEITNPDRARQLASQIHSAELRLRQARLSLQDTQKQQAERIEESELRTPISGIAVLPFQMPLVGEQLLQGQLIATVIDYHRMHLVLPVDELDVAKIEPGQRVLLAADALPGVNLTGQVSHISLQGEGQGGVATFDVTVELDPHEELRVGMTVHADIQVELRQATLLVPIEAVQYQDGKSFVDVVDEAAGRRQPGRRRVEVTTGANDLTRIEILSGLEEGWQVLIPGPPASLPEFGPGGGGPGGGGFGNGFQQESER